jgi:putative restriction endonuclease
LRDAAFRRKVLDSYDHTCAFTGLKIVNGAGRAEVDAAHIRPVGDNHRGADSIRNGLALSKTIHWLFDRGIVSISDNHEILQSPGRLPERLRPLFNANGRINVPKRQAEQPSPPNLSYHRRMFEDEYGRFELL